MLIHNALLTGSITLNGSDVSNITGSANYSASFSSRITNNEATGSTLTAASSSFSTRVTGLEASSGSFSTRTTSLEASSGSFSTRTTNIERVYATTGSNTFTAAQVIQGTLTAQTLIVQTVTSSVLFSTGSNKLGNSLSNVQELTGSVGITGSLTVVTTGTEFQVNAGGVNIGNALTDNHIISGSVTINPNGLFVSSSGNVGIGTTSPNVAFHISTPNSSTVAILESTAGANAFLGLRSTSGTNFVGNVSNTIIFEVSGSERMRIASTGNVGIGSTNPSAKLLVLDSAGTTTNTLLVESVAQTSGHTGYFYSNSAQSGNTLRVYQDGAGSTGPALYVYSDGAYGAAFEKGNVGIGTTSPSSALLQIEGNAGGGGYTNYQNFLFLKNTNTASSAVPAVNLFVGGDGDGLGVELVSNATVTSNGSAVTKGYAARASGHFRISNSASGGSEFLFRTAVAGSTTQVTRLTIDSSGNVALPNNTGNAGSGRVKFTNGNGVTWEIGHSTSFNIFIFVYNNGTVAQINPSTGAYTALSDINKKKDIQLSTIGLNEVLQLKPSSYKFKNDETEVEQLGFIAQEVKGIIPQAYVENDGFIGLTDRPIIAALVKAVQQQQSQIEELKAEIDILKQQ